MFQIGEQVVYGIHGICRVADQEQRRVDGKNVIYLSLEPVGQSGSKFLVPTHNAVAMAKLRYLLTREEAADLLSGRGIESTSWIQEENRRKQLYRELIASGNCHKLMAMVGMIYQHRASQSASGRKLHMCDEGFLRDAERLLITEISTVLEQKPEDIKQALRRCFNESA